MRLWHRLILAATLLLALSSVAVRELADAAGPYSIGIVVVASTGACASADLSAPPSSVTVPAEGTTIFCMRVLDGVATPVASQNLALSVSLGTLGTSGASKTATVTTDATGRATVQYNATNGALGNDTLVASNATLNAVGTVTIAVSGGVTPTPTPIVTPAPTPTAPPYSNGAMQIAYAADTGACASAGLGTSVNASVATATTGAVCVRALDGTGSPLASQTVLLIANSGRFGVGTSAQVTTDATGRASAVYTAPATAGIDNVTATNVSTSGTDALLTLSVGGAITVQLAVTDTPARCWGATSFPPSPNLTTIQADNQTMALCAFVRNSATNTAIAGANVTFTTALGYVGAGTDAVISAGADGNGNAATYYRGLGIATVDTITASYGGVTATANVTLSSSPVTIGTPPIVQLAVTDTPEHCWGATSFPPTPTLTAVPSNGSVSVALCAFVRDGATNLPIPGAQVTFTTALGYLGAGTYAVVSAGADSNGHAATYYRGSGIAGDDTVTATYNGIMAVETVTLGTSVTVGTPPIVQLLVTTTPEWCWGASSFSAVPKITLVPADGSLAVALCAFVRDSVTNAPVVGATVEFTTAAGYLGASEVVAIASTDANGRAAMYYRGSGVATTDAITAECNGVAAFSTVTLFTPGVNVNVTPVPTPTPIPTATPTTTPAPTASPTGRIASGSPPPANGGFSFFVFGGGTMPQLVQAAGCEGGRGAFWVTNPLGEFVTYVAGTLVSAVNAAWFALFPDGVPPGQPMMGSCR
ncbi:MAG: hypothetical protein WC211_10895 [Dehalococcoidia bacterium]